MSLPAAGPQARARDLLAVPFALVRVPLYLVDRQLVHRLDSRSGVRVVFDCGLGTLDIVAGHVLGDEGMTRYGIGRVQTALHRDATKAPLLADEKDALEPPD